MKRSAYQRATLVCIALHFCCCRVSGAITGPIAASAASSASSSETGEPSETIIARGIDISRSAGELAPQDFEKIKEQGYDFVIVAGWGGVNPNPHAQVQLSGARSAGLLTAGYCYLNFASSLDGGRQVGEALSAFSTEAGCLGFLAIDVETSAWNQLSPGLRRQPPDASAQQQAVARIAEAVRQVGRAGLRALIYTKKSDWQRLTGDTQQFKSVPLWHPNTTGGEELNQPPLDNPAQTFGGWMSRVGKQYELDTTLNNPPIPVDLNVFDLSAFCRGDPADGQPSETTMVVANQKQARFFRLALQRARRAR